MVVQGYSPGHITTFFKTDLSNKNILKQGSLGAGFCLSTGTITTLSLSDKNQILINGVHVENPIVTKKLLEIWGNHFPETRNQIFNLKINHRISLPQGGGFGTSGSGALSLAHALNKFFGKNLTSKELAVFAHISEIKCKTGLGTVSGEFKGGFSVRINPGTPTDKNVLNISIDKSTKLRCKIFYNGAISTVKYLSDYKIKKQIAIAGKQAMTKINKELNWQRLMQIATQFTETINIFPANLTNLFLYLKKSNVLPAQLMFGKGIYFLYNQEEKENIEKIVKQIPSFGYNLIYDNSDFFENNQLKNNELVVLDYEIDNKGARVISET